MSDISRLRLCAALVAGSWLACSDAPGAARPAPEITESDMRARITFLASDRLRGRATPSRGLEVAAQYIESEFRRFGLRPLADGYVHRYRLVTMEMGAGPRPTAEPPSAPNVMAVLPGRDPALGQEYVLVSAHMDGLGVGTPVEGDSIYNGADDNASGSSAVLELAEAVAALPRPPRRSILFLAVSGEERGLLGSAAFVASPPVPLRRIVANVNIDMIGRNWEDTIAVVGKPYSSLGALVDSVSIAHPEIGIAAVGDRWPSEGFFFRSDHFNFARNGIPAIFFFNGVHEDYHQPSDEVERIRFGKAARVTRLIYQVVLALAEGDEPPRWDDQARATIVEDAR